jgi:hypothetical protein
MGVTVQRSKVDEEGGQRILARVLKETLVSCSKGSSTEPEEGSVQETRGSEGLVMAEVEVTQMVRMPDEVDLVL